MFKDVFISYAREDLFYAEQLYDYLSGIGYNPWLDKRKLKAGSNWDYEIKRALKNAMYVILLLSSVSVKKRGYVQREFKYALNYAETKLTDDIYIIPVLLDKCPVPDELSKFQWAEYSGDGFLLSIADALNSQLKKYLQDQPADEIKINDYATFSIDLNISAAQKIDYNCSLPQFYLNGYFDADFVNTYIKEAGQSLISKYRNAFNGMPVLPEEDTGPMSVEIGHTIHSLNEKGLSLSIILQEYFGGPHPLTSTRTLNFRFRPERLIILDDMVETGGYFKFHEFLKSCIDKYGTSEQKDTLPTYLDRISPADISFFYDNENLTIDFLNYLPRGVQAIADLQIPLKELSLKT